jgi:hypothetical protein
MRYGATAAECGVIGMNGRLSRSVMPDLFGRAQPVLTVSLRMS